MNKDNPHDLLQQWIASVIRRDREAEKLINRAVELMTTEQLSQWEGVREWLEGGSE